jgi:hypothetical protein
MATAYAPAVAVSEVAGRLIEQHHPHLAAAPIFFVFVDPAPNVRGGKILGRARVVRGLNAFLVAAAAGEAEAPESGPVVADHSFFVMEVAFEEWVAASADARAALVDHELCHFDVIEDDDGEPQLRLRGHDVEEFTAVVERHGAWREDVVRFMGACSGSTGCTVGS